MATEITNATAFRVVLGTIGFALGFFGVEYVVDPAGGHRAFGVLLVASAFAAEVLAVKWPAIAVRAKARVKLLVILSVSILVGLIAQRVTGGTWRVAVVAGLEALGACFVLASVAFVVKLRSDLDRYAMPRIVTPHQAEAIRTNVQSTGTLTVKVNGHDREATEYASQLFNALRNTGWKVDFSTADAQPTPGHGVTHQLIGQNNAPDPRNPGRELAALVRALQKSGIEINGGGSQGAGEYKMYLMVGSRPISIGPPPLRNRIRGWLMRF